MKISALILFFLIYLLSACSSSSNVTQNTAEAKKPLTGNYAIYQNSNFITTQPDVLLTPNKGNRGFQIDIYKNIQYPRAAINNGIAGTVMVDIIADENGKFVDASIQQALHPDCDREALRCVKIAAKAGFIPAKMAGQPVKVKLGVPVNFRLE